MTWSLSMTITARVRLPYVASINEPRSRASWIILFIGADSGLTIEIIRLADTIFPNPILINLIDMIIIQSSIIYFGRVKHFLNTFIQYFELVPSVSQANFLYLLLF